MERGSEVEVVRQQVMGVVAVLLSLAALADQAACMSRRARARSLIYLRRAETVFLRFIVDVTGKPAFAPEAGGDSAEDAARLASRLRVLAVVLVVAVLPILVAGASGQRARTVVPLAAGNFLAPARQGRAKLPFDTS